MMTVDHYTHDMPDWPIVVYQAIDGQIPFAPFVAYPLIPTVEKTKQGMQRGVMVSVRCHGQTADEARAAACQWIAGEVEKNRKTEEGRRNAVEKRRAARQGEAA